MNQSPHPDFDRRATALWGLLLLSAAMWVVHPVAHAGEATHGASHQCSLCVTAATAPPAADAAVAGPTLVADLLPFPGNDAPARPVSWAQAAPRGPPVA